MRGALSITKVRDATILDIVIPAAFSPRESGEGIQWRSLSKTLDSRFCGNDGNFAEGVTYLNIPE